MSLILIKTLRNEPGENYTVRDASKHIIEIREVDMKRDYPGHYIHDKDLIWVTEEDLNYKHFIVNPKFKDEANVLRSEEYKKLAHIAITTIRNNKLEQLENG